MSKKKFEIPAFSETIHPALKAAFGYRFMHAALKYRKTLLDILDEYGMVPPQMAILEILDGSESINQVSLGSELGLDKVSIVRMIDGLQELEYVKRVQGKEDKREKIIQITKEGKETLVALRKRNVAREKKFLSPLTAAEAETLKKLIMKL
ncbi:MAG: MarR family transcriptional regulator [Rhizobacter sp.]|nr:MarR family transcriptional regulator [Bacteriovorax sp.]